MHLIGNRGSCFAESKLDLAATVVAATGGLDKAAASERRRRFEQIRFRRNGTVGTDRESVIAEPVFLQDAVLDDLHERPARSDWRVLRCGVKAGEGELLDLQRNHIAASREVG